MLPELEYELLDDFELESENGDWEFLISEQSDEFGDDFEQEYGVRVLPITTPEADYEVFGRDTRRWVRKTTKAPFRYICNLEYNYPGRGRWAMCSGTLIGPRTVLTAGHCIAGKDHSRMRIIPGRNGKREPFSSTRATKFILPRNYRPASPTDYGIIHLRSPIGKRVGYWSRKYRRNSRTDPVGTSISARALPLRAGVLKVNLSGYPTDKPRARRFGCWNRSLSRRRCYGTPIGDRRRKRICGTYQFRSYNRTVRLRGGILHYVNDTCPGHSGSPVWVKRHRSMGGRVLVGIHIAGDDPAISGLANRSVRINKTVLSFIIANTK